MLNEGLLQALNCMLDFITENCPTLINMNF